MVLYHFLEEGPEGPSYNCHINNFQINLKIIIFPWNQYQLNHINSFIDNYFPPLSLGHFDIKPHLGILWMKQARS